MFSIRAVVLDHYMSDPINELYVDEPSSDLNQFQEPVLRIFGSSSDGIKSCVHVHGVYPYVYVPYKGGENANRDCLLLGAALDEALAKANDYQKNNRYVFKVIPVMKIPLYGYHSKHKQFFQIFFCNPYHIRKAIELLMSGVILGQKFQPYEAHIPYTLQFMIDYNIYGMSFVTFSKVKYRKNPENSDLMHSENKGDTFSNKVKKVTWCYLEVDALAKDILNKDSKNVVSANPGLEAIWQEEKIRRKTHNKRSQISIPSTASRPHVDMYPSEVMYKEKLKRKLREISFEKTEVAVSTTEPEFLYPAEILENSSLLEGSISNEATNSIKSESIVSVIDDNILSHVVLSKKESSDSENEEVEGRIEADSILGRNHNEEEEAEFEDDAGGDMTQPLDMEENMMCESDANRSEQGQGCARTEDNFWKVMADRLFQFDGGQDSSSESDPEAAHKTLPRLSNSQVSVDTMLACCSPNSESMSNWSNNIMSILTEDNACMSPTISQYPQVLWSNYSTKMDSSWLYDNCREPWIWNKNEPVFEDCFSSKQKPDNVYDFFVDTAEELLKKKGSNEVCENFFESDQVDFSEHPFENISSICPISPPSSVINSPVNLDNHSETSVHSLCKRVSDTLKSYSPFEEKANATASKHVEKEMKTVTFRKNHKPDKINQHKFLNAWNVDEFSSVDRKHNEEGKKKPLTLKQYIRDCEEIVNIDFKNLSDREMVIIEYKPLNGKSTENKFLIKPLDKFLKNWNSAEKKVNNELINRGKTEDCWPKNVNKMKEMVTSNSSKKKNNLVKMLEHKYGSDWREPIKINSIKNKLVMKSMELPSNNDDGKTYKVNENVITEGKIKMKLTKSAEKDLIKKSPFRGKPSNYANGNKFHDTDSDVNANHISVYTCQNYLDRINNKVKKIAGKKKCVEETFQCTSKSEKINLLKLEEVRREKKKKESIKRKRTDVSDRFPKKLSKSSRTLNITDSDSKIINEINSCFEKYYKNIIKVNNFHNENDNNYFQDSEEELEDDGRGKKLINSIMGQQAENDLNFSNLDPVKFVTRLLSSFSHMSQSSEIPPLSITISLGNARNTSSSPIPIQLNLQPTVNVPTKFVKYSNKKHRKRVNFQNVDGPADSSSEDSNDSKSESSLKTRKKDGFYKPLKLISHNSGLVKRGRKRKISNFTNKKDDQVIKNPSSSLEVCSVTFSKNSEFSPILDEESCKRNSSSQEEGKLSEDSLNSQKNGKKIKQWHLATEKSLSQLSRNTSVSEAEPDFIYDSDKESHSKELNLKKEYKRKNFLDRIPQVDICLSTSEDEEVEMNLAHVHCSANPEKISETKEHVSEGTEVVGSNEFELDKFLTEKIDSGGNKDIAASSKIREDATDKPDAKLPNSETLSGMSGPFLCEFSSKSSVPYNSEPANGVATTKDQNLFSSVKSAHSDLSLPPANVENSRETSQKTYFKSTGAIPALPQAESDHSIGGTNRTPHPSSLIVAREFVLSSENLAIVSSVNDAQVITLSSDDKPMAKLFGQPIQEVLSSKGCSSHESDSSQRPDISGNVIFSQNSAVSSSEALNISFFNVSSATSIRGTKVVVPRKKPPKGNAVLSVLHETDLFPGWDEVPFYSDPRDQFRVMEVGPKILKIESSSIVELKTFKSSLNLLGTEERRENILNNRMQGCRGTRHLFVTNICIKIIPLRKPPVQADVIKWLQCKNKENNFDNKLGPTKTKIAVPLSPENGSELEEETDLSMTLSVPDKASPFINLASSDNCLGNSSNNFPRFQNSQIPKPLAGETEGVPEVHLRKGPLNKIKGIKRLVLQENSKKSDVEKDPLIECEKTFSKDSKQSSERSFQIRGITLNNTFGFDSSVENMQNIKLGQTHQYMSILVIEVHVFTRKDLRPDPRHDPIRALFYTVNFDDLEQNQETGIIVVGNKGVLADIGITVKTVHHVMSELELIQKTVELTRAWDPDILAGYEIEMNSWGYLVQRAFVLEKNLLCLLGRVQSGQREDAFSKGVADFLSDSDEYYETPKNVRQMKISGRIVLDFWRVLRHEIALTSYTFENVMYHLSHERHPMFSYETLSFYWEHESQRFRHITVEYYLTRVLGVFKLLDQLDFVNRTSELSRLFGIQFYEVLSRGSQFRVESMMLRLAKPLGYIPTSPSVAQRAAMRAPASLPLILEPESKFYADPVIVLDFQSLYPSMIIAYNYCFSTCLGRVDNLGSREPFEFGCTQLQISPEELKHLEKDVTVSPAGVAFVKSSIRKGVLPAMLEEILETRLMVKKSMKENKGHKTLEKLLFARQLGLKLIANVTYGYTAANFSGRMPCIEVGDSVVSKGRETLHRAIQLVKNTPKWGAKVVYGDTDSMFVLTPGKSRQEAFRIGAEIAEVVTQSNPKPVKLKLEKVYQPSILQTKKRYVGYMYESPEQSKPIFEAKGIETVRRDGCPAVGKILQKTLQILFDTRDVSLVKKYTIRQFGKLFQGRVNIQDLIFAKEYRGRKGYRPGACVPALQLAKEWTERDKRAEPRVKERVPYVIVNGPPGVPLIQCVRSPRDLISDPSLTINPVYYITKAIIPPMQRCFSLMGVDIMSWYLEIPRKYHKRYRVNHAEGQRRSTISQYFSTTECIVCSEVTNTQICLECQKQPQILAASLTEKIRRWESCYANTLKICQSCCGRPTELECQSIDCSVFFRRNRVSRDSDQALFLREIIHQYF